MQIRGIIRGVTNEPFQLNPSSRFAFGIMVETAAGEQVAIQFEYATMPIAALMRTAVTTGDNVECEVVKDGNFYTGAGNIYKLRPEISEVFRSQVLWEPFGAEDRFTPSEQANLRLQLSASAEQLAEELNLDLPQAEKVRSRLSDLAEAAVTLFKNDWVELAVGTSIQIMLDLGRGTELKNAILSRVGDILAFLGKKLLGVGTSNPELPAPKG